MVFRQMALAAVLVAASMAWTSQAGAQQLAADEATFRFKTEVMIGLSGYTLPPGEYTLKHMRDRTGMQPGLFWLYKGDEIGPEEPLAIIDAWDTGQPNERSGSTATTEAFIDVREPSRGKKMRVLQGFSIRNDYFKIRDVLAINLEEDESD